VKSHDELNELVDRLFEHPGWNGSQVEADEFAAGLNETLEVRTRPEQIAFLQWLLTRSVLNLTALGSFGAAAAALHQAGGVIAGLCSSPEEAQAAAQQAFGSMLGSMLNGPVDQDRLLTWLLDETLRHYTELSGPKAVAALAHQRADLLASVIS